MKNLVVFLYFVFIFKLAFAQSLPSLPGLDSDVDKNPNLIPEYVEVPSLEDDSDRFPTPVELPDFSNRGQVGFSPDEDFGSGWKDAPPAPPSVNTEIQAPPTITDNFAAPSVEIEQFKENSFEQKRPDEFSQELEIEDNFENITIENILEDEIEIDISKDQFPSTPSLGGFQQQIEKKERNTANFESGNIEQKENEVLEALFKKQQQTPQIEEIPLEDLSANNDPGVDKLNDFENVKNNRATHKPITYSEDQLVEHLVKAAMVGNRSAVLALLHSGRNANARNKFGETPLMAAIYNGHNSITEILLSEGAEPNARDNKGNTALHVATSKKNYFAIEKLINAGAEPNPRNRSNDTPLLIATLNNSLDIIDLLVRNGADVNKSNDDGLTPLHVATFNGNIEVVKYLLYVGSNANMINRDGLKPYDLAYGKNLEIARLLAGYTGSQRYISNDLPSLIQQHNNLNTQPLNPSNNNQQFSLFPQAYSDEASQEANNQIRARQSAWWGARQQAAQSVIPVNDAQIYNNSQPQKDNSAFATAQILPNPGQQLQQQTAYSPPIQQPQTNVREINNSFQQTNNYHNNSGEFDFDSISRNRANESGLSNVSKITNNYAPTKKPKNIISKNIDFIGTNSRPKSEIYDNKGAYAGLPTPKSMEQHNRYTNKQLRQQPKQVTANNNYYRQTTSPAAIKQTQQRLPKPASQKTLDTRKRVIRYSEMPADKKRSWDKNLEKWLLASQQVATFSPSEMKVWEKQRAILKSVYQNQFQRSVEQTKRLIASQKSSGLNMYGNSPRIRQNIRRNNNGLTRKQVGRGFQSSSYFLR